MAGRLPQVSWNVRDALNVYLLAWLGLPILILIFLAQAAPLSGLLTQFYRQLQAGNIAANLMLNIVNALAAFALMWHYLRRRRSKWRDLGLRPFDTWRAAGYVLFTLLGFAISVGVVFALVKVLWPAFNPDQAQTNEFTNPGTARQLSLLALVFIPPLIEETVFRGFIFPAFAKRWGFWAGAIITSLLFGFAHLQVNVALYTFVLSLLLCNMYYRLGSIWPGIILHMLNNYLAFSVLVK